MSDQKKFDVKIEPSGKSDHLTNVTKVAFPIKQQVYNYKPPEHLEYVISDVTDTHSGVPSGVNCLSTAVSSSLVVSPPEDKVSQADCQKITSDQNDKKNTTSNETQLPLDTNKVEQKEMTKKLSSNLNGNMKYF